jgi:digeranylgeranylglycerophospholipid reductase
VAPAPGIFQAGLATHATVKPGRKAFQSRMQGNVGLARASVQERPSGLSLCPGPLKNFATSNFVLTGDAAGLVSPLRGGDKNLAFRHDRRAGQLIADHLLRHGLPPAKVLAQ